MNTQLLSRRIFRKTVGIARMAAMATPPREKITTVEKIAHGTAIIVGVSAIPAWVLLHIKEYTKVPPS